MAVINSSRFNFADLIRSELTRYGTRVQEEVFEVVPEVAKEAAKKLKKESPRSTGGHGGTYAKGWKAKAEQGRLSVGAVVYGDKPSTYAVAHLLEKGHAKRGGGRTSALVHIKPVEEWAINEAYERIVQRLEKQG